MANLRFVYRVECFVGGDEWAVIDNVCSYDSPQDTRVSWALGNQSFRLGALSAIVDRDLQDPLTDKLYYDRWFSDDWIKWDRPSLQLLQIAVSRLSELGFVELSMNVLNRLHELYTVYEGGVKYAL